MKKSNSKRDSVLGLPGSLNLANVLDRAECAIRTVLQGRGPTARASLRQVKNAAAALSLQCAAGGESQGGIATNIGQSIHIYAI